MNNQRGSVLGTVLGMTALIGWLPFLVTWLLVDFALGHGAREWAEFTFNAIFATIHLSLMGLGAWIFAEWFGS